MNIVCIGGGPAGLYFGLLMKLENPDNRIVVIERNRPYDTFGWGVVFSDATLENLQQADPVSASTIEAEFSKWEDIGIHFKNESIRSTGHGFIGIGRKRLLNILQARCEELGVELVFETNVENEADIAREYNADLVIASDGINSAIRTKYQSEFQPDIDVRKCRFVWLGTEKIFDAFTFLFVPTEFGWFQVHAYQFEEGRSTFIVETTDETWQKAGINEMSQEEGIAFCEKIFAPWLDGHKLISNATHLRGSAIWIQFPRVICDNWVNWISVDNREVPIVLMGDAAHTAHFSIGSGTKLALEDAIELTQCLKQSEADLKAGLESYKQVRNVEVLKIQNAARNSTEWFENVKRYAHLSPKQFAYSLLTRSQRISHENLRLRDPKWINDYEKWLSQKLGNTQDSSNDIPLFNPYQVRGVTLSNRVVVSPTLLYSAHQGMPNNMHLTHLGARALGGAGLVMTEMVAVSNNARVTPGCAGIWNDEQRNEWKKVTDFVHQQSSASVGIQLGHAGRRGSTQLGWEDYDHPLEDDNWMTLSASAIPYHEKLSPAPREMSEEDIVVVIQDFVDAAKRANEAGFDWLELQASQGYLLSSFISPITNKRTDRYGGSLTNRMRFPIEVFTAVRQIWPADKPISVRISATDWLEGGTTVDDAVEISRIFKQAGADMIVVSSGEISPDQKPVYGRMYQTPMSDRIRNEADIATMAVGNISEADQINSIIASGRADLCALARPFMLNPHWLIEECKRMNWPIPLVSPYLAALPQDRRAAPSIKKQ